MILDEAQAIKSASRYVGVFTGHWNLGGNENHNIFLINLMKPVKLWLGFKYDNGIGEEWYFSWIFPHQPATIMTFFIFIFLVTK